MDTTILIILIVILAVCVATVSYFVFHKYFKGGDDMYIKLDTDFKIDSIPDRITFND